MAFALASRLALRSAFAFASAAALVDLEIEVLAKALSQEASGIWKYEQEGHKLTDREHVVASAMFHLASVLNQAASIQADPERRTVEEFLADLPDGSR